jgi:hypothetical protein
MALALSVPGVYFDQRPRVVGTPLVRTDIAGFIGFEPRLREAPDPGGAIRVDVAGVQLLVGGRTGRVKSQVVELAASAAAIPLVSGQGVVFAVAAFGAGDLSLAGVKGTPASSGLERPPDDAAVAAAIGTKTFVRIADVVVRQTASAILLTVVPALALTRCDDFRDYLLAFGPPVDDGTLLGPAVRAFFANGGRRCWIATVRRPNFLDAGELERARHEMIGVAGSSEKDATGLERLLLLPEVTFVDTPDLYARRVDRRTTTIPLPPREDEGCFIPCTGILGGGSATGTDQSPPLEGLFSSDPLYDGSTTPPTTNAVFDTQQRMLARTIPEAWRMLLLLSVPVRPDPAIAGRQVTPTHVDAALWLGQFDRLVKKDGFADTDELSCAALYWPWVFEQPQVEAPVREIPPSAYAAGIIARRDLARGPQISPANETLKQVVGLTAPIDDTVHGALYSPGVDNLGFAVPSVNVLRAFPGFGVQVWGARTLSTDPSLRFLSVRRTLTAIELRMKAALDQLVFEPNSAALWLQITQVAFSVLFPIFESGALRGERPEEAFFIRCDDSVNPPESIQQGLLVIEVGVAIAAPMEFIVFRLGRREGVVEVVE